MPADDPRNEDSPDDRSDPKRSDDLRWELARQIVKRQEELEEPFYRMAKEWLGIGKLEANAHKLGYRTDQVQLARIGDALAEALDREAEEAARDCGEEFARVRASLERTASLHCIADPVQQLEALQKYGPIFRPRLADLLEFLPLKDALELLESDELPRIQKSLFRIEYLNWDYPPFYTLDELQKLTTWFISHLERNREHLINTGYRRPGELHNSLETRTGGP